MIAVEIIKELQSDLPLLEKVELLPKEFTNTVKLKEALSAIYPNHNVTLATRYRAVIVYGKHSKLVINYEWGEQRKYVKIRNPRLITHTSKLTSLGIPKNTIYRLLKTGKVKHEKWKYEDYEAYAIDTVSLLESLTPELLENALKRSKKAKAVAEITQKKRTLAMLRAEELGIEYDYKLADDEYYEQVKAKILEKAKKLRKTVDSLDFTNKVLSYLIILNRYAKLDPKLYDLKEKLLEKLLPQAKAVFYLRSGDFYYDLWEIQFDYKGPLETHVRGLVSFHVPAPKIVGTNFEKKLKKACISKYYRSELSYGRPPTPLEKHAFPKEEVVSFLEKAIRDL